MLRRFALLAVVSACGSVEEQGDAPDELGAFRDGCGVLLRMNESTWSGADSVIDACGGDHNGTPSGSITPINDSVRGRVGSFPRNGCIEIADAPELRPSTALTMSAWVFPTGLDNLNAYGVISKRIDMDKDAAYSLFLWTGDNAWVSIEGNTNRFQNLTKLANQRWAQLTVVYDGSRAEAERARWFINGVFDVAGAETVTSIPPYTSPLKIGCLPIEDQDQDQQYFVGLLDDVAVWTRALSDSEVTQWHSMTAR